MSVIIAQGAGVRRRSRWLFRDLDVSVEPGELVAVVGPPGSGRTTALLALAGRFRLGAGKVTISGTASLGYVPEVEAPEPVFTVAEHVRERLALLGRPRAEAAGVPLHGLDPETTGRELTPYQKQVLGLVLAGLSRPAVIALDGVDNGLDAREQADLWRLLGEITAAGTAVLVTAREIDPSHGATVIRLGGPEQPAEARSAGPTSWRNRLRRLGSRTSAELEPDENEATPAEATEVAAPTGPTGPIGPIGPIESAEGEPIESAEGQPIELAEGQPIESAEGQPIEPDEDEPDEGEPIEPDEGDAGEPGEAEPAAGALDVESVLEDVDGVVR